MTVQQRVRVRFTKQGKIRWIGHRDVARLWERAFRQIRLPVALTEGFSPRPRISFGLALSTGHESLGEYLDVDLAEPVELGGLVPALCGALPAGLEAVALAEIGISEPSLQQDVTSCTWQLWVTGIAAADAADRVHAALGSDALIVRRARKGQTTEDDVRPAIRSLEILGVEVGSEDGAGPRVGLEAELLTQPRSLRPNELLMAVFPDSPGAAGGSTVEEQRVRRTHQWIERDGAKREPLPVDAAPPHGTAAPGHGDVLDATSRATPAGVPA